eukprot:scaffold37353_cov65-Phaeocystis_antarctica.AAC.1
MEAECLSHDLCGALGSCVESLLNELLAVHVHSDRRLQPLLDRSQGKLESLEQSAERRTVRRWTWCPNPHAA